MQVDKHPLIGRVVSYRPSRTHAYNRGHDEGRRLGVIVGVTTTAEGPSKVVIRDYADEGFHTIMNDREMARVQYFVKERTG